jgi:hypothetical protein
MTDYNPDFSALPQEKALHITHCTFCNTACEQAETGTSPDGLTTGLCTFCVNYNSFEEVKTAWAAILAELDATYRSTENM